MGYTREERAKYWNIVNREMKKNRETETPIIWATDNNGEIGRGKNEEKERKNIFAERERHRRKEIIGAHTRNKIIEKGNGKEFYECMKRNKLVEASTRYKCNQCNACKEGGKCHNTHTWTSLNGKSRRQIDYLAITGKQKNWIINIDKRQNASNTSTRQHKMITATIRRKYTKENKSSHRRKAHIDFDLNALRTEGESEKLRLTKEHFETAILKRYEEENEWERVNRIWKSTKKAIRKTIIKNFPKTEKEKKCNLSQEENLIVRKKIEEINEQKTKVEDIDTTTMTERESMRKKKSILAWKIWIQAKKEGLVDELRHSKHIDLTGNKTKTFNINKTIHYMQAKHTFNSKNECDRANRGKNTINEWKKIEGPQKKYDQNEIDENPANRNKNTNRINLNERTSPSTANAGMANVLHPNPHMKYDVKKNEFRKNINEYNVIEIANCIKIHTYENNFIEVSDKKDIEKRIMQIKKQNKEIAICLNKIKTLERDILKIRKIARERNIMQSINTFNENANSKNPKHTKKIWDFIKWVRKRKEDKYLENFTPLKKKNGELTRTLDENIMRWEEWTKEMFQVDDEAPKTFHYKKELWDKDLETIKNHIEKYEKNDTPEKRKAKMNRRKSTLKDAMKNDKKLEEFLSKPISKEEVRRAIKSLKNNKSFGNDRIPAEMYKENIEIMEDVIYEIIHTSIKQGKLIDDWAEGIITLLHKKNDKTDPNNYRPICLLNISYKILSIVICTRLNPIMNILTKETQTAYKNNRSTYDIISIVEKYTREYNCK